MDEKGLVVRIEDEQEYLVKKEKLKHGEMFYRRRVVRLTEEELSKWRRQRDDTHVMKFEGLLLWLMFSGSLSLAALASAQYLRIYMGTNETNWDPSTFVLICLLVAAVSGYLFFKRQNILFLKEKEVLKEKRDFLEKHGYGGAPGAVGLLEQERCAVVLLPFKSEFD